MDIMRLQCSHSHPMCDTCLKGVLQDLGIEGIKERVRAWGQLTNGCFRTGDTDIGSRAGNRANDWWDLLQRAEKLAGGK